MAHRATKLPLADSEPTPMATLSYGGIFGDNSGGAMPERHRSSTRPSGDEPSAVRHGMSVA
jgi:hypothetical protein